MRKVTFSCASSLDNYIAREDGSFDWIMHDEESSQILAEYWPRIDTIVLGRKTYDLAVSFQKRSKKKAAKSLHTGIKSYVFSRTLKPGERDGYTFVDEDPGKFVRKLKRQKGKEIFIMSGGSLARSLLEAGVINEIGLNIHPILLGSGIPLFYRMKRQIDLERIDCRPFANGCVFVKYRVKS
jgi:dihydrofolate reductase